MNTYSKALRHISMKDVKQKHQQKLTEQKLQEEVREKEKQYIKSVMETKKYDWRKEIEQVDDKVEEEVIVNTVDDFGYDWRGELVRDRSKYFETGSLEEGMTSKDFEYLYGLSITNLQIDSSLGRVQNNNAQEIVQASSEYSEYQFGDAFPGSFINSIGDNQIISQSKVDALAFLDTTYGNVSGSDNRFTLTTGPEGFPPTGQSPPGSVVSTTNLQTALGVTLPAGVPNGNLGGTPIEGSAIKRVFTKAEPGKRINFNWQFASSEDALGAGSVDDYAFVAIKGTVTKFVSVLTKGLTYGGQFIYTVQPEDIVDGKVEIGIGVMDVFDPYVQTALTISNFGTFWAAGSLGSTTDAADLGMSVAAGMPQSQQKKKSEEPFKLPGGGTLTKGSDTGFTPQTTFTYDKVTDSGVQKVTTTIPKSASSSTILKSFNQYTQGKSPSFAVGFIEGLGSVEKSEVLKSLGPSAVETFNQIQQYKELNKKLSQSKNPADWDKAVQVSGSIQQLYDKFGKEMETIDYKNKLSAYEKALAANKQKSDELSRAVDAARAEYLKPGQTYAQIMASYDKLQAAIKASTDNALSGLKNPIIKPTPPTTQTPQSKLTPEKLANIEASLKQLEIDKQKDKDEANKRNWELAANLAMDALTAAALLSPIPGDEAIAIGARTAAQTRALARNFQRQNPGKYNPFISDKANQLARQQGVGTNVKGQNPAFRNPIKNSYEPQGEVISEKSSTKRLKTVQQALYPGQPSPNGFPDTPPPEMVNGYHPDFGQKDNMYNTLDKTSADSMPLTGNGKIDKKIKAARKQSK